MQQRTDEIRALMRRTAEDIIAIGRKLSEVKARLGHGQFLAWLEAEFGWHRCTANRFMQVAEAFSAVEMSQIATFAPSALYLLAAPSTPETARARGAGAGRGRGGHHAQPGARHPGPASGLAAHGRRSDGSGRRAGDARCGQNRRRPLLT